MFVALRDLRFAKGRFALIIGVVLLISLMVGMLGGLMQGLQGQSISAIEGLSTENLVFAESPTGDAPMIADSSLTANQIDAWTAAAGHATVSQIGISMGRLGSANGEQSASLFGVDASFTGIPGGGALPGKGSIVLTRTIATDLGVDTGSQVTLVNQALTVEGVVDDAWLSHTPVVWINLLDWQAFEAATGSPDTAATMLAVTGMPSHDRDTLARETATTVLSKADAPSAVSGYSSEHGSLLAMLGMLLAISALVIGAFFTVWTIQRTSDIAILKALGASTRALAIDALGQALVVLGIGVGLGTAITIGIGTIASQVVPFSLTASSILLPAGLLIALGLIGAAVAVRSIVSTDPLSAIATA